MATFTSTAKYALRWLTGSNLISDVDLGFQTLAGDIEANMAGYAEGTWAGMPAAGKAGRLYRCTDTATVYMDTGSAWIPHGPAPGDLKASAVSAAPTGWLVCDGALVLRAGVNAALFSAIGVAYNVGGEALTSFRLPDLRGRVPVGVDGAAGRLSASDTLGAFGGEEKHTLTTAEQASGGFYLPGIANPAYSRKFITASGTDPVLGVDTSSMSTGQKFGDGPHNNMPPYQVVNWLVKL